MLKYQIVCDWVVIQRSHFTQSQTDTFTERVALAVVTHVFGSCSVRISAGTLYILNEVFRGFPKFPGANAGVIFRIRHDGFPPRPFLFIIHITSYHLMLYSVATDSIVICPPETHRQGKVTNFWICALQACNARDVAMITSSQRSRR
jgi:hypothetical protein